MEIPTRAVTHFIAIDGEGDDWQTYTTSIGGEEREVTIQYYTSMACSLGEEFALMHTDRYGKRQPLSTEECLNWICDIAKTHPEHVMVGFGLSYDCNMMLRDLPFDKLKALHDQNKVRDHAAFAGVNVGIFSLRWLPRKYIEITRYQHTEENGRYKLKWKTVRHKNGTTSARRIVDITVRVWDTIGFFQSSFLEAVKLFNMPVEDIDFITRMKGSRNDLASHDNAEIIHYSTRECQILVDLLRQLDHYLHHPDIDITLKGWGGAGYIAAALMDKYHVRDHIQPLPPEVLTAALHAYSGGRIELIRYGHYKKTVWDYDVNSSYPTDLSQLPSLTGGIWHHTNTLPLHDFAMVHVKWNYRTSGKRIMPFPYREEEARIIYPTVGEGWVWMPEYKAALKHLDKYPNSTLDVLEGWDFFPANEHKPFSFIPVLAAQRLIWKKEFKASKGTLGGQNIPVKLGLNSLYGKTAQQAGGALDKDGNPILPPYHNMAWAGYVTSSTRAKLYDAAMQDEDSVIMFATDGLFATTPRDLPIGEQLGEWEATTIDEIIIVQSGVYYYRSGSTWKQRTRGFRPESLERDRILQAWKEKDNGGWRVEGITRKFVTFGMIATATTSKTIREAMNRFCTWETQKRVLQLTPAGTKRDHMNNDMFRTKKNPANGLLATYPKENETPNSISRIYQYVYLLDEDSLNDDQRAYRMEVLENTDNYESM